VLLIEGAKPPSMAKSSVDVRFLVFAIKDDRN